VLITEEKITKGSIMGITKIVDFLNTTQDKHFYRQWFINTCEIICENQNRDMKEWEMSSLLECYFNQIKSGRN